MARPCRLIRNEVLPLFYSNCIFQIDFKILKPSLGYNHPGVRLSDETYIFLSTLAKGSVGDLRKLRFRFFDVMGGNVFWESHKIDLDFSSGSTCYSIFATNEREAQAYNGNLGGGRMGFIEKEMSEVLEDISERTGTETRKLRFVDFYAFRKAVEDGCKCLICRFGP